MFELEVLTTVRVLDVRTLTRKDRQPNDPPGAQLLLQATLPSSILAVFDAALPGWLYRKSSAPKQAALDGMEGVERTAIGEHVKRLPWDYEQTGCELVIDRGTGGKSNLELSDCKVHRVSIVPQETGARVQWTVDAPGLSDDTRGKLSGLKATDIQMTLAGPTVHDDQGRIDDGAGGDKAAEPRKPAAAERAAVAKVKGGVSDTDAWPFPTGDKPASSEAPPQSVTTEPISTTRNPAQSRTAKGREKTARALASGALS